MKVKRRLKTLPINELTNFKVCLYSPSMTLKKLLGSSLIKGIFLAAILLVGNFYLSERRQSLEKSEVASGVLLVHNSIIAENSGSNKTDGKANDVTGHNAPKNHAGVWLIAVDLVNSFGKSAYQRHYHSPNIADLVPKEFQESKSRSVQSVCQVSAELGRLFTLIGERPSGTS